MEVRRLEMSNMAANSGSNAEWVFSFWDEKFQIISVRLSCSVWGGAIWITEMRG